MKFKKLIFCLSFILLNVVSSWAITRDQTGIVKKGVRVIFCWKKAPVTFFKKSL
jgi:hypothetical protein